MRPQTLTRFSKILCGIVSFCILLLPPLQASTAIGKELLSELGHILTIEPVLIENPDTIEPILDHEIEHKSFTQQVVHGSANTNIDHEDCVSNCIVLEIEFLEHQLIPEPPLSIDQMRPKHTRELVQVILSLPKEPPRL